MRIQGSALPNWSPVSQDEAKAQNQATVPAELTRPKAVRDMRASRLAGVGPSSDNDVKKGVYLHALARELAPEFVDALHAALPGQVETLATGYGGPRDGYSKDPNLVWVRDYLPLWVNRSDGTLATVKFDSPNVTRRDTDPSTWVPVNPPKIGQKLYRAPGETSGGRWIDTERCALVFEPGNLVVSGGYGIVTSQIFADNPGLTESEVLDRLAASCRIARSYLVVVDPLPGEKTKHADMSVLSTADGKVLVPEIRDEALQTITYAHEIALGTAVKNQLDATAAKLAAAGLQVERAPMMPPVFLTADKTQPGGYNGVFYSPANTFLLATDKGRFGFLPTFDAKDFPPAYQALKDKYAAEANKLLTADGYATQTIDATALGRAYGLFHCLTSTQSI